MLRKISPYILIACGIIVLAVAAMNPATNTGWRNVFNLVVGFGFIVIGIMALRWQRSRGE